MRRRCAGAIARPRYRIDDAGHLLTERKKVDTAVRMLLEDGLKEVEKGLRVYYDRYTRSRDRFFMLPGLNQPVLSLTKL